MSLPLTGERRMQLFVQGLYQLIPSVVLRGIYMLVYTAIPPISGKHQEIKVVLPSPLQEKTRVQESYKGSILPLCFSDLVLQPSAFLDDGSALSHA